MNTVDELVSQIKTATDYQKNKKLLREKILADLHVPYNSGMFLVNHSLLAFLATWPDDELFLEDIYNNPIKVNKAELLDLARKHYYEVMNSWHQHHEKLKYIRKI